MNLLQRFKIGLGKTRSQTVGKIADIFKRGKIDEDALEEVEDTLLEADIGVDAVEELMENLRENLSSDSAARKQNPVREDHNRRETVLLFRSSRQTQRDRSGGHLQGCCG